jgi:feruloyl esterase
MTPRFVAPLALIALALSASAAESATCDGLSTLTLANGTVTLAQVTAAGSFKAPGRGGGGPPGAASQYAALPEFCRVAVTLRPTPNSDIKAEVWLPSAGWNGKLQVVGNGAFAGTISYPALATAIAAGYAAASTDTGHTGASSNTFANEDVVIDFAHRAVHESTVAAKVVVRGLYGEVPKFSYFNGCSTGGRQAMTAAQRYPDDFNGIVAGAPALYGSKQSFGQIWIYQAMADPSATLPLEARRIVNESVLAACDGLDGARDGVLENPRACRFDPQILVCKEGTDPAACLTQPQIDAVKKIYAGASNPRTGEKIFAGLERGSELGWLAQPVSYAVDYFRYRVFKDASWDPRSLDFDSHLRLVNTPANLIFDATNPDLSPFTRRGGKLIMYQGWAEPGIPPGYVGDYYAQVLAKTRNARDSVRLFMVPGMGHCGGGNGASTFDMVAALDRWVTKTTAPASIPASRVREGKVDRTRPLCPYPQIARYKGTGDIEDAANFSCSAAR